jgi:hypothetical protein
MAYSRLKELKYPYVYRELRLSTHEPRLEKMEGKLNNGLTLVREILHSLPGKKMPYTRFDGANHETEPQFVATRINGVVVFGQMQARS